MHPRTLVRRKCTRRYLVDHVSLIFYSNSKLFSLQYLSNPYSNRKLSRARGQELGCWASWSILPCSFPRIWIAIDRNARVNIKCRDLSTYPPALIYCGVTRLSRPSEAWYASERGEETMAWVQFNVKTSNFSLNSLDMSAFVLPSGSPSHKRNS